MEVFYQRKPLFLWKPHDDRLSLGISSLLDSSSINISACIPRISQNVGNPAQLQIRPNHFALSRTVKHSQGKLQALCLEDPHRPVNRTYPSKRSKKMSYAFPDLLIWIEYDAILVIVNKTYGKADF